jgi:uncharacterized protein YbaA (DUF1428 family)
MTYIDGFVIPVPIENKDAYREAARRFWDFLRDNGALRVAECWGDDVPEGKVTDFRRAVAAQPGENVVFSWVTWPSKEARDAAHAKMRDDPAMQGMSMPFDGKRMIFGGFSPLLELGGER